MPRVMNDRPYKRQRLAKPVVAKVPRPIRAKIPQTTIVRTLYQGNWTFGTASTNDFWRYPVWNVTAHYNNFAELANVFDQYKVNWIKVTYRPKYDNVTPADITSAAVPSQSLPYAVVVKDPTSRLAPAGVYSSGTMNVLMEEGGFVSTLTKPLSIKYTPMIELPTNQGGGIQYVKAPWLSTGSAAVQHRGYHMFLVNNNFSTTAPSLQLDTYITMSISFKGLR